MGGAGSEEEQLEAWLQAPLDMMQSGGSDTVAVLHGMQQQHAWIKLLGDVYSALLYMRGRYSGKGVR